MTSFNVRGGSFIDLSSLISPFLIPSRSLIAAVSGGITRSSSALHFSRSSVSSATACDMIFSSELIFSDSMLASACFDSTLRISSSIAIVDDLICASREVSESFIAFTRRSIMSI